jgi:uncharacterized protein YciI
MKKIIVLVFSIGFLSVSSVAQEKKSRIIEDGGSGKYSAIMMAEPSLPSHTLFRPQDITTFGRNNKLPVIAWGNGACYNSPWEHVNFLNEVASHGFLVIATGTMPREEGEQEKSRSASKQLLDAIDWAIAQNKDKNSPYFNKIDTNKIAVSGMSCGGLQTLEVAPDPRITTIVVCNSGLFDEPAGRMPGMPLLKKDQLEKITYTNTLSSGRKVRYCL